MQEPKLSVRTQHILEDALLFVFSKSHDTGLFPLDGLVSLSQKSVAGNTSVGDLTGDFKEDFSEQSRRASLTYSPGRGAVALGGAKEGRSLLQGKRQNLRRGLNGASRCHPGLAPGCEV